MSVKINIHNEPIQMKDLPQGEFCRRLTDNKYFLKTNEMGTVTSCLCVCLDGMNVHRIREDTMVEQVPHTEISFFWR